MDRWRPYISFFMQHPTLGTPNLLGAGLDELAAIVSGLGEPAFRARQLYDGIFRQRIGHLGELTSLPGRLRELLGHRYSVDRPRIAQVQTSGDGTRKYQFFGGDGLAFEAVYIPEVASGRKTNTLCISSQTGCSVGCRFCYTASLRHNRNLTAAEIIGQVLAAESNVAPLGPSARISNIVFMGMGEPLLNFDEVVRACGLLLDGDGLDFTSRRVTISTSGIVPRIRELGQILPTQLAISLNATTDEVRTRIMPINKKWPIAELLAALRAYPLGPRRRFTIEYVLLRGVNDSLDDAKRLPKLLARLPVKVNLLPLNAHERTEFLPPDPAQVDRFQDVLRRAGLTTLRRTARGQEIAAACGQLGEHTPPAEAPSSLGAP